MKQSKATGIRVLRKIRYFGRARLCIVCGSHLRRFLPHGQPVREQSVCPICFARERHRLAWLWFVREFGIRDWRGHLLHVAPEPALVGLFERLPKLRYATGDLVHRAQLRFDVGKLPFGDSQFDAIYCSHVLNMLPSDDAAIREHFRVLKRGAVAVIQVPVMRQLPTLEAGASASREVRMELFGDPDIYRHYGPDISNRLEQAGLDVTTVSYFHQVRVDERIRFGLINEDIYVCRRPR